MGKTKGKKVKDSTDEELAEYLEKNVSRHAVSLKKHLEQKGDERGVQLFIEVAKDTMIAMELFKRFSKQAKKLIKELEQIKQ